MEDKIKRVFKVQSEAFKCRQEAGYIPERYANRWVEQGAKSAHSESCSGRYGKTEGQQD